MTGLLGSHAPRANLRRSAVPPRVHETLRGTGRTLEPETRRVMERRLGFDFGRVRVHTGVDAAASARAVGARAYTVGSHVVFGADAGLRSPAALGLLAHKLVHVAQQADVPDRGEIDPHGRHTSRSEREAAAGARAIFGGRAVNVTERSARRRLDRAEHGTYVSTVGQPEYLNAGAEFYRTWGHPNVRRVATMEEVLKDLDRAKGPIDRFRIVSHGSGIGLEFGLLPELLPDRFYAGEATTYTTEQRFRRDVVELRIVTDSLFKEAIDALHKDSVTAAHVTALGVASGLPDPVSAVGILLRAYVESRYLANLRLDTGGVPNIPHRAVLEQFNSMRIAAYRRPAIAEATPTDPKAGAAAIDGIAAELRRVLQGTSLASPTVTEEQAKSFVDPQFVGSKGGLAPNVAREVSEGAGGPYLRALRSVRGKVTTATHIEIRGCNVGRQPTTLSAFRSFFGGTQLPAISAPDLFQFFFRLNFTTLTDPEVARAFGDPATGLKFGFTQQSRMRAGEGLRVVDESTLDDFARKYGYDLTRLLRLNPEIPASKNVGGGTVVWLKRRLLVQAGRYTRLADFCRDYLGQEYAWPQVWAANAWLKDPAGLKPSDTITIPAGLLGADPASAARDLPEATAALAGGAAFVGMAQRAGGDNAPVLYVADTQRADALAKWLAAQRFDPRGRTAAALSRLYAGKRFGPQAHNTYIQFLSSSLSAVLDPVFPEDPRYAPHIIRQP